MKSSSSVIIFKIFVNYKVIYLMSDVRMLKCLYIFMYVYINDKTVYLFIKG